MTSCSQRSFCLIFRSFGEDGRAVGFALYGFHITGGKVYSVSVSKDLELVSHELNAFCEGRHPMFPGLQQLMSFSSSCKVGCSLLSCQKDLQTPSAELQTNMEADDLLYRLLHNPTVSRILVLQRRPSSTLTAIAHVAETLRNRERRPIGIYLRAVQFWRAGTCHT